MLHRRVCSYSRELPLRLGVDLTGHCALVAHSVFVLAGLTGRMVGSCLLFSSVLRCFIRLRCRPLTVPPYNTLPHIVAEKIVVIISVLLNEATCLMMATVAARCPTRQHGGGSALYPDLFGHSCTQMVLMLYYVLTLVCTLGTVPSGRCRTLHECRPVAGTTPRPGPLTFQRLGRIVDTA